MQPAFWTLFADNDTRRIFSAIARRRTVPYKVLREIFPSLEKEEIERRLNKLKEARYIDVTGGPFDDFKIYYVTTEGLSAERELDR
jgi:hypothetical protein